MKELLFLALLSFSFPSKLESGSKVQECVPEVRIVVKYKYVKLDETTPHMNPLPTGRVGTRRFGYRMHPILKKVRMHKGIDITAKKGELVYAPSNGYVCKVEKKGGYGLKIVIVHDKRIKTLYAHLSKSHVKVGDFVNTGDVIGEVGSTGLSTGPHLHFEIIKDGKVINPESYIEFSRV